MDKRKRLVDLLKAESVKPKKYSSGKERIVVMPSPIQKRDLTDYEYGKNIDEKVVKMACTLAEKMAISLVRETIGYMDTSDMVEKIVDQLGEKIAAAIPDQTTVIQQVVASETESLKKEMKDLVFEGADIAIDRSKGLKLHGKVGSKTNSEDSTDDALDMLDSLEL